MNIKNVLVVDDSQTSLFDIRQKIQDTEFNVNILLSTNYIDAKRILSSDTIHLAIIDLQMPDKNGADLIVMMKSSKSLKEIPIIVLTSTGMNSLIKTSLEPLVNHYLSKPVSKSQIHQLLEEFLG